VEAFPIKYKLCSNLIMKNLTVVFLLLLFNNLFAQWEQYNWPVDDVSAFFFKDSVSGLVLGYGRPYKTVNGGHTWFIPQGSQPYFLHHQLYFINDDIGFGYEHNIRKTTNMGDSWIDVTPEGYHDFCDMYFVDDTTGYVVGDEGEIYITNDQGETWEDISYERDDKYRLYSVYFLDKNNGWIHGSEVGGYYFKLLTSDKGQNWERVWFYPIISEIQFISRDLGYGLVRGRGRLYKTVNAGESWSEITMPHEVYSGVINRIYFINENIGFACGGVVDSSNYLMGRIYKTIDGGQSWETIYVTNVSSIVKNILFLTEEMGWGQSTLGLLITGNGGVTSVKNSSKYSLGNYLILFDNYPNPFNPATIIEYLLEKPGNVSIIVYDQLGRVIKRYINEYKNSGHYKVEFDGSNISSGIYYYQLIFENDVLTKSMILLK
jgi:hypothetical protein